MNDWVPACLRIREYELFETDNVGSAPTTRHALDLSEVRANETERI